MLYSKEVGRLYCVSDDYWASIFAIQGSTHEHCWYLAYESEARDICADTARGKLYCGSWPNVTVVDLSRRIVTANMSPWSWDDGPVAGCVNEPLGKTYVLTDRGDVLVIDAVADTVVTSLSLDSTVKWNFTACAATAGRVLCTATDTGYAVLIDCAKDSVVDEVRLNSAAEVLEAGLDGMTFVAATSGYLYVIEAGTGAILDSVKTGPDPSAICRVSPMHKLYLADMDERCLYVLSMSLDSVIGRVELDGTPYGLCYDSVDSKLYVACTEDDAVWVVDCARDTVTARIEIAVSGRTSPLSYSAFGNRIYFASGDSIGVIECCLDRVTEWFHSRCYDWCTPRVFPALHLVSGTSEGQYITIFEDPPARPVVTSAGQRREPTVARGMLHVAGASTGRLFDLSGRSVLDLLPGWNDVSGLPPGIYFAREQTADGSEPARTRKVVILP
jgi:DNA-binding beta-propeller fold protein YncE